MKTAVMIIANNGFQDHEFSATYEALQEANAQITIAAWRKWQCVWVFGQKIEASYELSEIKWDKFGMVIFIWWWGCLTQYLHNADYLRIAQEAKKLWAICIAPMVVSESGVFNWKIVTSRDDEWLQQKFIESYGGVWKDEIVIRYGNIVTANWPEAAEMFGQECVKLLEDETF